MNVVITGSLGHISKPLANQLIGQGHRVTVISSNPEKQPELAAMGASAAIGSVEDAIFLTNTFAGADAVYVMVPPRYSELNQVQYYQRLARNYAQAIKQSGVKRAVHLSSYGAHLNKDTGMILGAHHAERILNDLADVSITHLRPGYFYYNLYSFVGMIKQAGFIGSNYGGDDKLVLVDPSDIATAAAEELQAMRTGRTIRYVASDERTCAEITHVLGKAIGNPDLSWMVLTNEQVQKGMQEQGMSTELIQNFVDMGAAIHSGVLQEDYIQHKPVLGNVKLEDFAREFAVVYKEEPAANHG